MSLKAQSASPPRIAAAPSVVPVSPASVSMRVVSRFAAMEAFVMARAVASTNVPSMKLTADSDYVSHFPLYVRSGPVVLVSSKDGPASSAGFFLQVEKRRRRILRSEL